MSNKFDKNKNDNNEFEDLGSKNKNFFDIPENEALDDEDFDIVPINIEDDGEFTSEHLHEVQRELSREKVSEVPSEVVPTPIFGANNTQNVNKNDDFEKNKVYEAPTPTYVKSEPIVPMEIPMEKDKSKPILIGGLIFTTLGMLILGAMLMFGGGGNSEVPKTAEQLLAEKELAELKDEKLKDQFLEEYNKELAENDKIKAEAMEKQLADMEEKYKLELAEKTNSLNTQITSLTAERDKLKTDYTDLNNKYESLNTTFNERIKASTDATNSANDELTKTKSDLEKMKSERDALAKQVESLSSEIKNISKALTELQNKSND